MSVDVVHARNCLAGDGQSSHSVGLGDGVAVRPGSNGETALEIRKICNCCGRHRTGRAPSFEVDSTRVRIESSRVASSQPAGSVQYTTGTEEAACRPCARSNLAAIACGLLSAPSPDGNVPLTMMQQQPWRAREGRRVSARPRNPGAWRRSKRD